MSKTMSPLVASKPVLFLAILAIVFLSIPTLLGGWLLRVPSVPSPSGAPAQGQTANTSTQLSAAEFAVSVAERNTAWATYVVTAVGILFTLVVVVSTLWNESRYSAMHSEWEELSNRVQSEAEVVMRNVKRQICQISLPMADFLVRTAIYETMYPGVKRGPIPDNDYLARTAHDGVKLLVRYAEGYSQKEAAVRRLSRVISHSTLDCLNEIERIVLEFEPNRKRDDLRRVIHTTRDVVEGALKNPAK